jgi:hypothetical protein
MGIGENGIVTAVAGHPGSVGSTNRDLVIVNTPGLG